MEWFLWALALFAILTKATRHVPPIVQIAVAAAVNVFGFPVRSVMESMNPPEEVTPKAKSWTMASVPRLVM